MSGKALCYRRTTNKLLKTRAHVSRSSIRKHRCACAYDWRAQYNWYDATMHALTSDCLPSVRFVTPTWCIFIRKKIVSYVFWREHSHKFHIHTVILEFPHLTDTQKICVDTFRPTNWQLNVKRTKVVVYGQGHCKDLKHPHPQTHPSGAKNTPKQRGVNERLTFRRDLSHSRGDRFTNCSSRNIYERSCCVDERILLIVPRHS